MSDDTRDKPAPSHAHSHLEGQVLSDLLAESRQFPPSPQFSEQATVRDESHYKQAEANWQGYWASRARELHWFAPWERLFDWNPPHCQWYIGGRLNLSYNCLDRHLADWRRNKPAIIWEGEPCGPGAPGEQQTLTYAQLHREVCLAASALKRLGVGRGDRVAIYLPMVPEAAVAMLACARLGAIHSVVFGGFSAESLSDRINDCDCKAVITADGGWRRGRALALKAEVDKALQSCPGVKDVLVVQRDNGRSFACQMYAGRDHWWHELLADADPDCAPEPMDSEDVLFILYTSGTTGKPKGIVHTTGGYSVMAQATCRDVFDLKDDDVFWCTADVGWVTGHTYVVYGPLQCGATVLMYEGAPDWPGQDRFWDIIARRKVSVFYTAPTAIRAFMKWGSQHPAKHDLSSLRLLGSVGEPINPEAWIWYHEHIGHGRCPVVDTWWQTETGGIMITTLPGLHTSVPGFAGRPLPGISAALLDDKGVAVPEPQGEYCASGLLALTRPWPSMLRTLWGDDERFKETYFSRWSDADGLPRRDLYFPGDGAKKDAQGNYMILGRVDDVLNVAGHRIGTMEVESALVDHHWVAESAVVGRAHDIKGQALVAFVTLKSGAEAGARASADSGARASLPANPAGTESRTSDGAAALEAWQAGVIAELKQHVVNKIGAIARPEEIILSADLPKTRSGKIMRRLLRDIAEGRTLGDTTTLADPNVVDALRQQYEAEEG